MIHATPDGTADANQEAWEGGEQLDWRAALEADEPPPTADQFDIVEMQHWIDLSA